MDGPGTISWEEFVDNATELVTLSDKISDHWQFSGDKKSPGQAYLIRQEKIFIPIDYPIDDLHLENEDKKSEHESDEEWCKNFDACADPFEATCIKERPLVLEHHILWSMSYSVPVIYFNGWRSDFPGVNPVSVEVAQRLLKNDRLSYTELSQAIHPLLGRPFLHLHPCGSRELLKNLSRSFNRLVSWLSVVAPAALNLRLRPEYFQLTMSDGGGKVKGCEAPEALEE